MLFPLSASAATSTINPLLPVNGQQLQAPPVQQNFQHAYNDINNIYATIANIPNTSGSPNTLAGYNMTGNLTNISIGSGLALSGNILTSTGQGISALTGDVTGAGNGSVATTVAKIQGVSVGTPTGTGNVVFSVSPTLTGTLNAAAETLSGNLTTNITGSTQCVHANSSGVLSGTGSDCGSSGGTITLTGDTTGSGTTSIATTTSKVHGVAYGTSPSTNTVPVVTGTNAVTYETVPNAALANSSLTVAGHSISLGGTQTLAASDLTNGTTGSGAVVLASSPSLTTPNIGSATGSVSGNAGTATTLQTARAINGVNFDGSSPITVTAAAGTLTGTTLNSTVVSSSLTSLGTVTSGSVSAILPTATTSILGVVKPDGTSITISGGVISATGGSATVSLGTSASVTNPQRTSEATTGFYSLASGKVEVAGVGNLISEFTNTGSANSLLFQNSATTVAPSVSAVGSDTNVNLSLVAQGVGVVTTSNFMHSGNCQVTTSAFNVTSSTALTAITGLSFSLLAGVSYSFEIVLFTTSNSSSGGKIDLAGGTVASPTFLIWDDIGALVSGGAGARNSTLTGTDLWTSTQNVTTDIKGTIVVNGAGSFAPRFAQNVSGGTASVVTRGSYMCISPY